MSEPLVTVIIPTFNRRRWIGECLDSVRAQTYPRVETLVVDDGSTDGTVEWLRSEPRYEFARLHVQPKNGGASVARNTGIQISKGDLFVFIDSDDALAPTHVERAVSVFRERPNVGLFCCDSTIIGPDSEVLFDGRTWHEIQRSRRGGPSTLARAAPATSSSSRTSFRASPSRGRSSSASATSTSPSSRWTTPT